MEFLTHLLDKIPVAPIQFVYGAIAVCGGIARYLNSYTTGQVPFSARMILASTLVSGFSGYMLYSLGVAIALPVPMLSIMAGVGGFYGDQTMKLMMEFVQKKVVTKPE